MHMPGGAGHDQFDGGYFTRAGAARSGSHLAQLASLLWLIEVSDDGALRDSRRVVYGSECVQHKFEHAERKNIDRLLVKKGSSWECRLEHRNTVISEFPDFWSGSLYDAAGHRRYRRGEVLFLLEEGKLNFEKLFSSFAQVYLVGRLSKEVGRSLYNRAMKYTADHPAATVVALYGGTKLAIFPGTDVLNARFEQAMAAVVFA